MIRYILLQNRAGKVRESGRGRDAHRARGRWARAPGSRAAIRGACVPPAGAGGRGESAGDRCRPPPPFQTRLAKYYAPVDAAAKRALEYDVHRLTAGRDGALASVVEHGSAKVVFRRYAGLYFAIGADAADSELALLEAIHLFVEVGRRDGGGRFFSVFLSAHTPTLSPPLPDPGPLLWQRV